MRALLSIRPQYTKLIFAGQKRFEYRRTIFKQPISSVVVYASAPVSMVIGEFEVTGVFHDHIDALWDSTSSHGGVSKQFFYSYFSGKEQGYAIGIGNTTLYRVPKGLQQEYGVRPPQSFLYLG